MLKAKTRKQELALLKNDNTRFTATKRYLKPLIVHVLDQFELHPSTRRKLLRDLLSDVGRAGYLFLEFSRGKDYRFSTYYTWYIGQRLNPVLKKFHVKRKPKKERMKTKPGRYPLSGFVFLLFSLI